MSIGTVQAPPVVCDTRAEAYALNLASKGKGDLVIVMNPPSLYAVDGQPRGLKQLAGVGNRGEKGDTGDRGTADVWDQANNTGDVTMSLASLGQQRWSGLAGQATVALPDTTTLATGRRFTLVNDDDVYSVEVVCFGSDVVAGHVARMLLYPGDTVDLSRVAAGKWRVVGESLAVPNNPAMYLNWSTGSDNDSGTAAHPWKSFQAALAFLARRHWTGEPRIYMAAVEPLGSNPKIQFPVSGAAGLHEPILVQGTVTTDSGQGTRTVSSAAAGSGLTFGTITDSSATWSSNQWRGFLVRITSGAQAGKEYWISKNTATQLTLVGTQTAPLAGATFVIEEPGAGFSWTNRLSVLGNGTVVGLKGVMLLGDGATSALEWYAGTYFYQTWRVKNVIASSSRGGARFESLSTFTNTFSDNPSLNVCGMSWKGSAACLVTYDGAAYLNFSRSLFADTALECTRGNGYCQVVTAYFVGNSYFRAINSTTSLGTAIFDTVTPAPSGAVVGTSGAAVVIGKGGHCVMTTVSIDNTPNTSAPGDAVKVSKAIVDMTTVTGAGNAGVGVTLTDNAIVKNLGGNTVTGTANLQIGGNASTSVWGNGNDLAAATPQLCAVVS